MEKEKISKILAAIAAAIGVLVMATPRYILPVCEHYGKLMETKMGMKIPMKCSWMAQGELGVGLVILVAGLLLLLSRQAETKKMLNAVLVVLGVIVILLPTTLIGVCANIEMPCNAAAAALQLLGGLLVVVAALGIYAAKDWAMCKN